MPIDSTTSVLRVVAYSADFGLRLGHLAPRRLCPLGRLRAVCGHDRADQSREALLDLRAARGIAHFDAVPLAADQAGFAQRAEVLRKRRLGNGAVADLEKVGTRQRAVGGGDAGVDRGTHRIGQRVEYALDGDVLDRRVDQGFHAAILSALEKSFYSS